MITDKRLSQLNCIDYTDLNLFIIGKYAMEDYVTASDLFNEASPRQQNNLLLFVKHNEDYQPSVQRALFNFFNDLITE